MKWKHWVRYPLDIRVARNALGPRTQRVDSVEGRTTVGIDLVDDAMLIDCGRHLACIAAHAARARFSVILRCDSVLLGAIAHKALGKRFLSMPCVTHIAPKQPFPDGSLVLTDSDPGRCRRPLTGQHVVRMLIGRDAVPETPVMPYPMFPDQIDALDGDALQQLRCQPKAGIFFAGNQKSRYGRDSMRREFGLLSRLEVIDSLADAFPDRIESLDAAGRRDRIVLRATHQHPIASTQWMPTLARHRFFLCCPGVSQPVCHNVIEAMSVGMIPILEYGDRFVPSLVDGVNAITFHGRDGLVEALARIDAMPEEQLSLMSAKVCKHYDRHLCGTRFLTELSRLASQGLVDAVSMPFHNRNLFVFPPARQGEWTDRADAA